MPLLTLSLSDPKPSQDQCVNRVNFGIYAQNILSQMNSVNFGNMIPAQMKTLILKGVVNRVNFGRPYAKLNSDMNRGKIVNFAIPLAGLQIGKGGVNRVNFDSRYFNKMALNQ